VAFWHFSQNGNGVGLVFEPMKLSHHVVIEADSAEAVNAKAIDLGLYFNGVDDGIDCSCCGDRWSSAYGDGDILPRIYGKDVSGGVYVDPFLKRMGDKPEGFIHYANGLVVAVEQMTDDVVD